MSRPNIGVGVIVMKDNKVLMGKRKNAHGSDDWAFPGGHLEFGETVESCAKRELLEEVGLKAHTIKLVDSWAENVIAEGTNFQGKFRRASLRNVKDGSGLIGRNSPHLFFLPSVLLKKNY